MIQSTAEIAEMIEETESHFASRSDIWREAEDEEMEYWRKKSADAVPKKRSGGKGRREVVSEMRRVTERIRKRKTTTADWRDVK